MGTRFMFYTGGAYIGGAELHALHLMSALRARGDDLRCIFNGWSDGAFPAMLQNAGIPADPLKLGALYIRKPLWTADTLVNWPGAAIRHARLLRGFNPDWHIHMTSTSVVMLPGQIVKPRTAYYELEMLNDSRKTRLRTALLGRKVDRFLCVSGAVRRMLIEFGIESGRIHVVPPVVTADERSDAQPPPAAADRPVRIGIVGLVIERKGHQEALAALRHLLDKKRNCELHIYGKGEPEYEAVLRDRARALGVDHAVRWMGFQRDRSAIYANLDMVLVPSRGDSEGFGMVAAEPGLWSLPVVASRSGGLAEVVVDGETGLLCNPDDANDLAQKADQLCANPELRRRLGQRARVSVRERYSAGAVLRQLDEALRR